MFFYICLFSILVVNQIIEAHEEFLSSVSDKVNKENFNYYKVTYDGTILVELISTSGDCDLYVSQNSLKPSYEPNSNCLQSVTCGIDSVIIPKRFKRPVGIGIFGHPSHESSTYHLILYRIDDSLDLLNFDPYKEVVNNNFTKAKNFESQPENEGKQSFLKDLFLFVLDVLVEGFL